MIVFHINKGQGRGMEIITYIFSVISIFSLLATAFFGQQLAILSLKISLIENIGFMVYILSSFALAMMIYSNTAQINYFSHKGSLMGLMFLYMTLCKITFC
jgi:hypothetical protein